MACKERLKKYLKDKGVEFKTMTHPEVYTAQEVAAAQHVPGKQLAKVVVAEADERLVMLALPASRLVDFKKLKTLLGAKKVRLAKEEDFSSSFPDCEIGAMPPFGNLYDVPVYVDSSLTEGPEIVFRAGTHRDTMKVRYADFERLVKPKVGDFSVHI